jgi:hypothetical protein
VTDRRRDDDENDVVRGQAAIGIGAPSIPQRVPLQYRRNAKPESCGNPTCTRCAAAKAGEDLGYDW